MKLREKDNDGKRSDIGRGGAARSLGEVLRKERAAKQRRTFERVRRNSYNVGEREKRFYQARSKEQTIAILRAAERLDDFARKQGERSGPIGEIGLKLLKLLCKLICWRTGRLEPSIEYMMRMLRRSRGAIVRAKERLKQHGFLDWMRRVEPTENPGQGPQVRQISNAYVLKLPGSEQVDIALTPPPIPDDAAQALAVQAADVAAMIEALPIKERLALTIDDPQLAATLARMAEHLGVD